MIRKFTFTLLLIVSILNSYAQQTAPTGEVRGFVYDKKTGEPVIFTNVFLKGTNIGVSTDVNGFYNLTKLKPGSFKLVSTGIGYDTASVNITIKAGQKITQNLYLSERSVNVKEVEITADKTEAKTETKISVVKVTPKQISQIPSVGGEPDLAQYLQVLPGVVFTGDQGGQLYIRGGAPIQNKVLLDGMVIYNPFHSIGLYSVFETDIIRNAEVHTGGFGAEYGGRVSAIMDVTTRDGNKKRFGGKVATNPFTSKVLLEGPLSKYVEGKGTSSFIISGRTSYLESTSKSIYSYVDTAGLPYNFNDIYAKISLNGNNGSKMNLFGFNFTDEVKFKAPAALKWNSTGAGTSFVLVPDGSSVLIDGNFAFSNYKISQPQLITSPRFSEISGFNTGLNFTYFYGKDELKYGIDMLGFKTDFNFTNPNGVLIQQKQFTTEIASYFKYKHLTSRLILEPSIRFHYYASLSELSIEPRFSTKFIINENIRFKGAAGYYSQNLLSATSDRDVVNLFYGFLSGPSNLPKTFKGESVNTALQKARHLIAGFEFDLFKFLTLNVEGYIKKFDQLTNVNRDKLYPDDEEFADKPAYQRMDYIIEDGIANGIDLTLKYEHKGFYLWTTYSLAKVSRTDELRTYVPHYDRRHNMNIVSSYVFGKNQSWEIDVRWNLGSGFPFTQTQGFYEKVGFNNIFDDYTNNSGQLGVIYADLNKGRLPWYHRLDVSVKKQWKLSENSRIEANLGATNIYNRDNLFYFDRLSNSKRYQLPFLPSLGVNVTF